jgi:dephospho-CoA kinase
MIIGLTGGIASGKSESSKHFKSLGFFLIDADIISSIFITRNKSIFNKILKICGKNILCLNGSLNKKKIANIIFSNNYKKKKIEKILHPLIINYIKKIIIKKKSKQNILINAPLLFESGLNKVCDKVVFLWVPYDIQISRSMLRDDRKIDEIQNIIYSQMPTWKKLDFSDFVINNIGSKIELKNIINNLYKLLTC